MPREIKSGDSSPGSEPVEIAGETDEGFVQIENRKPKSPAKTAVVSSSFPVVQEPPKKPQISAAVGDVPLEGPSGGSGDADEEVGGGGSWWGGLPEGVPRSESSQSGSWNLGGWLQMAKDKTVAGATSAAGVLDLVRRDLSEFTLETGSVVTSTASRLGDKLHISDGVSSVFNAVSGAFYIPPDDDDDDVAMVVGGDSVPLDRLEKELIDLMADVKTYTEDPEDASYADWSAKFDSAARQQEMSDLLVKYQMLRMHYKKVVPARATHAEFWQRYFFKVEQIRAADEKRKEIKKRAEEAIVDVGKETSDWDDDVM
ncbi:unnamed protein product [Notodromas monacha]|uniref:BSD domain-containing protein n=1 Tax=Notodromas monacha TaxID=399045 RepID=A0A7R9GDZ3_9CRUS|nr:unnamed protein product [Notodromas monacha]CAG0919059.1 unnamed protein product [Notodromas monacha]